MGADILFDAVTIAASGSATSQTIRLRDGKTSHAVEYVITGDGTQQFTVFTSISGREWISNGVKASGLVKTSGPGSDGKDNIPLVIKPGDFFKVVALETGGGNGNVLSMWFAQK